MAPRPPDAEEPRDESTTGPVQGSVGRGPDGGADDRPDGDADDRPTGEAGARQDEEPGTPSQDGPGRPTSTTGPGDARPGTTGAEGPPGADDARHRAPAAGGPGGVPEAEVEARWQEIVAQLGELAVPPETDGAPHGPLDRRRPARRDVRPGERRADGGPRGPWSPGAPGLPGAGGLTGGSPTPPPPRRRPGASDPLHGHAEQPGPAPDRQEPVLGPRSWSPDPAVEEADDHFHPPEPGPVLGGDPLLTLAWGAVVGMPALFLLTVLLWRDVPTVVLLGAAVAFLVGLGVLLWRMPHRRDDDAGPGAVV